MTDPDNGFVCNRVGPDHKFGSMYCPACRPPIQDKLVSHVEYVQRRCGTRLCQVEHSITSEKFGPICDVDVPYLVADILDAVPDGWAKVDGEWIRITSDGVGYGEFDRET